MYPRRAKGSDSILYHRASAKGGKGGRGRAAARLVFLLAAAGAAV